MSANRETRSVSEVADGRLGSRVKRPQGRCSILSSTSARGVFVSFTARAVIPNPVVATAGPQPRLYYARSPGEGSVCTRSALETRW